MFDSLDREHLHHAYVCVGDTMRVGPLVFSLIERVSGMPIAGNPNIWSWKGESFLMDEAQEVRRVQEGAAFGTDQKRFFVIEFGTINVNAQNALLKTLEEPKAGHHFFLITPSVTIFLPTLLSRVVVVHEKRAGLQEESRTQALAFLNGNSGARAEIIKPFLKKISGDSNADKDEKRELKRQADLFIQTLERVIEEKLPSPNAYRALREIETVRHYIHDAAGNARLILEHLALTI